MRILDPGAGREVLALHGHRFPTASVAWSPDGALLVSAGGAREDPLSRVRLWTRR